MCERLTLLSVCTVNLTSCNKIGIISFPINLAAISTRAILCNYIPFIHATSFVCAAYSSVAFFYQHTVKHFAAVHLATW